jgi:GH25 family lysozyme M1 (1,4-beta-N-acetylmuramidase)
MTQAVIQQQRPVAIPVPPVPPSGISLKPGDEGPDVSSYQPNVDWQQVAGAGYKFAFVKATEATNYTNPYFAQDWQAISGQGLVRGAYHFARPDSNSPEAEVQFFLNTVGPLHPDDLVVLDIEAGAGDLSGWAIRFGNGLPVGQRMLYSGPWFIDPHGLADPSVAAAFDDKLWLAAYQGTCPAPPPGWAEVTFWQYTDKEPIAGIGACDCSRYKP